MAMLMILALAALLLELMELDKRVSFSVQKWLFVDFQLVDSIVAVLSV